MQQQKIRHGKDCANVELAPKSAKKMKNNLKLEVQSEYYIRISDMKYLNFIMFCLTAKIDVNADILQKMISKLSQGQRDQIVYYYQKYNEARDTFHAPKQICRLGKQLSFQVQLLDKVYKFFADSQNILKIVNDFKEEFNVPIIYGGNKTGTHYGKDTKILNPTNVIVIRQDENSKNTSFLIAGYSNEPETFVEEKNQEKQSIRAEKKISKSSGKKLKQQELQEINNPSVMQLPQIQEPSKVHRFYFVIFLIIFVFTVLFLIIEDKDNYLGHLFKQVMPPIFVPLLDKVPLISQ